MDGWMDGVDEWVIKIKIIIDKYLKKKSSEALQEMNAVLMARMFLLDFARIYEPRESKFEKKIQN